MAADNLTFRSSTTLRSSTTDDAPLHDAPLINAPLINAPLINAPLINAPLRLSTLSAYGFINAPLINAPLINAPLINAPPLALVQALSRATRRCDASRSTALRSRHSGGHGSRYPPSGGSGSGSALLQVQLHASAERIRG